MYIEWGRSRGCSDADTEWICSRGEIKTARSMHKLITEVCNINEYFVSIVMNVV